MQPRAAQRAQQGTEHPKPEAPSPVSPQEKQKNSPRKVPHRVRRVKQSSGGDYLLYIQVSAAAKRSQLEVIRARVVRRRVFPQHQQPPPSPVPLCFIACCADSLGQEEGGEGWGGGEMMGGMADGWGWMWIWGDGEGN